MSIAGGSTPGNMSTLLGGYSLVSGPCEIREIEQRRRELMKERGAKALANIISCPAGAIYQDVIKEAYPFAKPLVEIQVAETSAGCQNDTVQDANNRERRQIFASLTQADPVLLDLESSTGEEAEGNESANPFDYDDLAVNVQGSILRGREISARLEELSDSSEWTGDVSSELSARLSAPATEQLLQLVPALQKHLTPGSCYSLENEYGQPQDSASKSNQEVQSTFFTAPSAAQQDQDRCTDDSSKTLAARAGSEASFQTYVASTSSFSRGQHDYLRDMRLARQREEFEFAISKALAVLRKMKLPDANLDSD